jgi:NAD(P)-dependent dehydrogenase (short-subunit alcohol dehydrogenase family)
MNLAGKVCLVTGGTSGIGSAAALLLAEQGADIGILGRKSCENARQLEANIRSRGRRFYCSTGDVAKADDCRRFVEDAASIFGAVDVLIHSAGGLMSGGLLDVNLNDWYNAFDVHVHAAFHLCRAVVPFMRDRGEGAIVLISSVAGLRGCKGTIAYGVAKGAIPQMVRALARELADLNIRVNAVAPGVIRTPLQDVLTPEQVTNNIENRIPLHREGTPEGVAKAIALLIENEFITGETLTIDGGMAMRMV